MKLEQKVAPMVIMKIPQPLVRLVKALIQLHEHRYHGGLEFHFSLGIPGGWRSGQSGKLEDIDRIMWLAEESPPATISTASPPASA